MNRPQLPIFDCRLPIGFGRPIDNRQSAIGNPSRLKGAKRDKNSTESLHEPGIALGATPCQAPDSGNPSAAKRGHPLPLASAEPGSERGWGEAPRGGTGRTNSGLKAEAWGEKASALQLIKVLSR